MSRDLQKLEKVFSLPMGILKLTDSQESQRGIVADTDLEPYESFLQLTPKVHVLNSYRSDSHSQYRGNSCAFCLHEGELPLTSSNPLTLVTADGERIPIASYFEKRKMLRCQGCHVQLYCCRLCQLKDWEIHEFECTAFTKYRRRFQHQVPDTFEIMVIRCLLRYSKYERFRTQLQHMSNHSAEMNTRKEYMEKTASVIQKVSTISSWDKYLIARVCHVLYINSMMMFDCFGDLIGQMFDPTISLFNHSCDPNASILFINNKIKLVANRKILKGEDIFVNYSLLELPSFLRQRDLSNRFFFQCRCPRCDIGGDSDQVGRCDQCNKIVWDYNIGNYIKKEKPIAKASVYDECCVKSYKIAMDYYMDLYKDYLKLIHGDNIQDTDQISDKMIEMSYIQLELDYNLFNKYEKLSKMSIQLFPPWSFPLCQIYNSMVKYNDDRVLDPDPLISLRIYFLTYFSQKDDSCLFPSKIYTFLIEILQLRELKWVKDSVYNRAVFTKMTLTLSIICFDKLSQLYGEDSKIYQRCAVILYNQHYAINSTDERDNEYNSIIQKWVQKSLTVDKLNEAIVEFYNLLKAKDDSFSQFKHSILQLNKDLNIRELLQRSHDYTISCFQFD